jgi:hypothetical protein
MTVGLAVDKGQIDSWSGQLSRDIDVWSGRVDKLEAFLLATPDATLTAPPFNYTAGEVALLKSSIADLKQLADLFRGVGALAAAKDFRTFSKQLIGLGI